MMTTKGDGGDTTNTAVSPCSHGGWVVSNDSPAPTPHHCEHLLTGWSGC
jgi:hypothetical protein